MLLLFYAIMMLRNTAFAASEAVTTIPSARRCSQPPPLTGEIYSFRNQGRDIHMKKNLFLGMTLGMACLQKKLSLKCKKPALFRAGQLVRIKP